MDRPPIERMKQIWLSAGEGSFPSEISLCDYALELEEVLEELAAYGNNRAIIDILLRKQTE